MWEELGIILLIVGGVGAARQCVIFIKETLPGYYGENPGFGCLEAAVAPWHAIGCLGLGLVLESWPWGVLIFGTGLFCYGLFAMLLSRLLRGRQN